MKTTILLALLFFGFSAQAALTLPTSANYESGRTLCQKTYANLIAHEKGIFVSVPFDYSNPSLGTTDIYSYFVGGVYDSSKETLLYFTGGPGSTAHWGLFRQAMPYNVLIMEQRGIGCSRPATLAQYLNPAFYSSENVARDAERVRQHLGISKWTVYGISYGTVPATIYSSLFPQATRATILEGVVFDGESGLWDAPHRRKLLQRMLGTLPAEILKKLDQVHAQFGVPAIWLSNYARTQMMYDDGLNKIKERFLGFTDETKYQEFIKEMVSMFEPINYTPHVLFISNDIPYFMIACQELGLALPNMSTADVYKNGVLTPVVDIESQGNCRQLRAVTKATYKAERYPLTVPVTYFQGADDSATASPQAIKHYKIVPKASKQILIQVRGGHNPNLQLVNTENIRQAQFFDLAFKGQKIPRSLVKEFNDNEEVFWAFTSN